MKAKQSKAEHLLCNGFGFCVFFFAFVFRLLYILLIHCEYEIRNSEAISSKLASSKNRVHLKAFTSDGDVSLFYFSLRLSPVRSVSCLDPR